MRTGAAMLATLLLASCAAVSPAPIRLLPPADLLADCAEPQLQPQTNGQLAELALQLRDALRGCNRDKAALREWAR